MSLQIKRYEATDEAALFNLIRSEGEEWGYKARLTAPPVDGKANEALIELLSKEFSAPKRDIEITKGATGRDKTVTIKTKI